MLDTGCSMLDARYWMFDDRGRKTDDGGQRTEDSLLISDCGLRIRKNRLLRVA
ncbi:MAG: hypothetical protein ABSB91_04800 [Sedimentisphaerales bacterium]